MMWIAKPLQSLSIAERSAWYELEPKLPLAQTLAWGKAIEAVAGRTYLIFNPEEKVGGLVFSGATGPGSAEGPGHFECINGPYLHWDDPNAISRQLATFAMAVARVDHSFRSLCLRPRWNAGKNENAERIASVPVPLYNQTHAATWIVPILKTPVDQFQALRGRLQRTLRRAQSLGVAGRWEKLDPALLDPFVKALREFGAAHDFTVPPVSWFKALSSTAELSRLSFLARDCRKKNERFYCRNFSTPSMYSRGHGSLSFWV